MTKKCRVCLFDNKDEAEFCQQCQSKFYKSFFEWIFSADYPKPIVVDNAKSQWRTTLLALGAILLICSIGCLPGLVFGRALFPREVQKISLVKETVVVTATSTPTPVGPTHTPTVTGTPTPIPTATPSPTPQPTTIPGTVLEPRQFCVGNGVLAWFDVAAIRPNQLLIDLSLRNIGAEPILLEIKADMIRMKNSSGDIIGPPTNVYGHLIFGWQGGSISLAPGESFVITKGGGFQESNLAGLNEVFVEIIGLTTRIEKCTWRVQIPR